MAGIGLSAAFFAMKEPPEKKAEKVIHPLVKVETITVAPMQLSVDSYGIVKPKYTTDLVAQVNGQIIHISDNFVRGGFVKAGEILVKIDPSDYEAALIEAQANLAQASSALEIEQAQAHVAKTEWQRIKNNTNATIPSELYLRKPQLAEKLARFRAAQASVKRAKRNFERTYIKAPYDALIESRNVSLGSVVSPGNQFGTLNAISVAEIRLPVADKDLQYLVNNGIDAPVTFSAKFAGKPVQWNGKVVRSEGVIDERSRMTYLVAQVDLPYDLNAKPLRFGTYLNAKIEGQLLQSAVAVPSHLVNDGKIATLQENSTLTFKSLNVVRETNGYIIADQGLDNGNQIITSALEYPSDGMTVRIENTLLKTPDTQLALKKE
jgi:RND family efflux transporter MFP subunit